MNFFDSLPIRAIINGFVGIRARKWGISPGSSCKTDDKVMLDGIVDNKGKSI